MYNESGVHTCICHLLELEQEYTCVHVTLSCHGGEASHINIICQTSHCHEPIVHCINTCTC